MKELTKLANKVSYAEMQPELRNHAKTLRISIAQRLKMGESPEAIRAELTARYSAALVTKQTVTNAVTTEKATTEKADC